jgi:hypothetical protein
MKRLILAAALLVAGARAAQAQHFGSYTRPPTAPGYRPPVSPYLNILRPGGNPALNYYNLTRPQQQFGASIAQNQADLLALQQQQLQQQGGDLGGQTSAGVGPITGHRSSFYNLGHYYNFSPFRANVAAGAAPTTGPTFGSPGTRPGIGIGLAIIPGGRR